ncbi:interleukin-13 receptor subunit alpha-2 isoform X2 [Larimichthys crocea]|uniref:interleukin-13 receptor subunit alpha-2 isoform X2 n=1 Tax=Larimichthys crocea TaxID=215358 RepID=UPI000900A46B|nr:interleukin-13 receptor subunit alpha-2 isoform X2 [Larimichthys crocea]
MARKLSLTHLMLLALTWRGTVVQCLALTAGSPAVDPPEDLLISDPGHLGHLDISWSVPAAVRNLTPECARCVYQLEYFNTNTGSWSAVRTARRSYRAQFDLMKDVRVRVYTLLDGPCTNSTVIKSQNYTEVVRRPAGTGVVGTEVQDFLCVYQNMKHLECRWRRSPKTPADSLQSFYFWHRELDHAEECPKYIMLGGVRSGCDFTDKPLPDFTDINFCVNGSSPDGLLRPSFFSLQIQNHVKPEPAQLHLHVEADQLQLRWERPAGRVPGHCLDWEVEQNQEGPDGKMKSEKVNVQQTSFALTSVHDKDRSCFRVRSKLSRYCADRSFWSEWSQPACYPEEEAVPEPEPDLVLVYVYVAIAIIAMLVVLLCVGLVLKVRRSRKTKKPDSLLTTLFARNSAVVATEA